MLIPDSYSKIRKERGRSLAEIGVQEIAFTREDAIAALEALKGSQAGVLGGDVLRVADGKLTYTYDNWHADKNVREDILEFLKRSIREAEDYIRSYPDPEDGTIFYSLVISELGVINEGPLHEL